jgi:hypothetical protein
LWRCRYRISYIVAGVDDAAADIQLEFLEM